VLPDPTLMLQQLQQQLRQASSRDKQQQQQQQQQRQASSASSKHGCVSSSLHCAGHVHQHRHSHRPRTAASASTSSSSTTSGTASVAATTSRHSQLWGRTGGASAIDLLAGRLASMPRPSTAPAPQGHTSSSSDWGSNLAAATVGCSEEISFEISSQVCRGTGDSLAVVRPATAVRAAAAAGAVSATAPGALGMQRRPSCELPARHAVLASAAGVKMAAVLTQHRRKTGAQ
jgi:hypothetical protein